LKNVIGGKKNPTHKKKQTKKNIAAGYIYELWEYSTAPPNQSRHVSAHPQPIPDENKSESDKPVFCTTHMG